MTIGTEGPLEEVNKFGLRLRDWVENLVGLPALRKMLGWVPGSSLAFMMWDRYWRAVHYLEAHPGLGWDGVSIIFNCMLSNDLPGENMEDLDFRLLLTDPEEYFAQSLGYAAGTPQIRSTFEGIGAVIYDTSVGLITGKAAPEQSEAAGRARAFVGYVTALGALPQLMATKAKVASKGKGINIGDNVANVFYNLGLGFLTWQTMAPVLEAAILEPLTEDVQRQWRGKRFTRNENQDLFALGKISREEFSDSLKGLGWRDQDIDKVIELAYKGLSRGDMVDLWHKGLWNDTQVAQGIRSLGYSPENVDLILRLEDKEDVANDRKESISVLTNSFEDGLLPEADLRSALDAQGYTDREIDLRIQLVRLKQADKARKLTVAQLKNAWQENVVGDPEVIFRLKEEGYAEEEVQIILDTWKGELVPDFVRVNHSTILDMYRYGIIDRFAALQKLGEIGYNEDDAKALVDLEEAKFPEAFGGAPARKQRILSLGAVVDLVAMGRLEDDQVRQWAKQSGFSDSDMEHMVELVRQQAKAVIRPLSQSTIEDAYVTGVFSRGEATGSLQNIGFTAEDANVILQVVEEQNPAVFAPGTITSLRQPTIGALVTAVQSGFITESEFYEKAALIGYNREGATVYLENARAKLVKGSKKLTKADILEFYRKNLLDYPSAYKELTDQGYSPRDADLLLRSEQKGVQSTDVWSAMLAGYLAPEDAYVALIGLGFSEEEVDAAFDAL